jgi:hypothetical protein
LRLRLPCTAQIRGRSRASSQGSAAAHLAGLLPPFAHAQQIAQEYAAIASFPVNGQSAAAAASPSGQQAHPGGHPAPFAHQPSHALQRLVAFAQQRAAQPPAPNAGSLATPSAAAPPPLPAASQPPGRPAVRFDLGADAGGGGGGSFGGFDGLGPPLSSFDQPGQSFDTGGFAGSFDSSSVSGGDRSFDAQPPKSPGGGDPRSDLLTSSNLRGGRPDGGNNGGKRPGGLPVGFPGSSFDRLDSGLSGSHLGAHLDASGHASGSVSFFKPPASLSSSDAPEEAAPEADLQATPGAAPQGNGGCSGGAASSVLLFAMVVGSAGQQCSAPVPVGSLTLAQAAAWGIHFAPPLPFAPAAAHAPLRGASALTARIVAPVPTFARGGLPNPSYPPTSYPACIAAPPLSPPQEPRDNPPPMPVGGHTGGGGFRGAGSPVGLGGPGGGSYPGGFPGLGGGYAHGLDGGGGGASLADRLAARSMSGDTMGVAEALSGMRYSSDRFHSGLNDGAQRPAPTSLGSHHVAATSQAAHGNASAHAQARNLAAQTEQYAAPLAQASAPPFGGSPAGQAQSAGGKRARTEMV